MNTKHRTQHTRSPSQKRMSSKDTRHVSREPELRHHRLKPRTQLAPMRELRAALQHGHAAAAHWPAGVFTMLYVTRHAPFQRKASDAPSAEVTCRLIPAPAPVDGSGVRPVSVYDGSHPAAGLVPPEESAEGE